MLFELFSHDFARSSGHCATLQVDDAGATFGATGQLKHADSDVKGSSCASSGSISLLRGPGVGLEIVKDRIKGELTLTHWHQESLKCFNIALSERVAC